MTAALHETPSFEAIVATSERVAWKLDDVLSPREELDFGRPMLPESLAETHGSGLLEAREALVLNHIRSHGYLATFGLVEEFILPYVLHHVDDRAAEELAETRALLAFATEEAKHIELFRRFAAAFTRGFGRPCPVIGPAEAIAQEVLGRDPLAVGLLILHIEWMTQAHYKDVVRDTEELEPAFRRLLHMHYLEEAQHARIDEWLVLKQASERTACEREQAIHGYLDLVGFFEAGFRDQAELDVATLEQVLQARLLPKHRRRLVEQQHRSLCRTYLRAGAHHPRVLAVADSVHPGSSALLRERV